MILSFTSYTGWSIKKHLWAREHIWQSWNHLYICITVIFWKYFIPVIHYSRQSEFQILTSHFFLGLDISCLFKVVFFEYVAFSLSLLCVLQSTKTYTCTHTHTYILFLLQNLHFHLFSNQSSVFQHTIINHRLLSAIQTWCYALRGAVLIRHARASGSSRSARGARCVLG